MYIDNKLGDGTPPRKSRTTTCTKSPRFKINGAIILVTEGPVTCEITADVPLTTISNSIKRLARFGTFHAYVSDCIGSAT